MPFSKFALRHTLSACAITAAILSAGSNAAFAQCVTTGAITANCDLAADTTGAITIGNGGNFVTVTVISNVTITDTINDDDATPDGNISQQVRGL